MDALLCTVWVYKCDFFASTTAEAFAVVHLMIRGSGRKGAANGRMRCAVTRAVHMPHAPSFSLLASHRQTDENSRFRLSVRNLFAEGHTRCTTKFAPDARDSLARRGPQRKRGSLLSRYYAERYHSATMYKYLCTAMEPQSPHHQSHQDRVRDAMIQRDLSKGFQGIMRVTRR